MTAIHNKHHREQNDGIELPFMDKNEIEAIKMCLNLFDRPIRALEWGSGRSTLFFSSLLPQGSSWVALEHDAGWHKEMKTKIAMHPSSCASIVFIQPNKPFDGLADGDFATFHDYVLAPAHMGTTFDFILVDGRARIECLAIGWNLLKENGVMVLHDAQRKEYHAGIPKDCISIRVTNPKLFVEGYVSTLFMTKDHDIANSLMKSIANSLGNDMLFETTNFAQLNNLDPSTRTSDSSKSKAQDNIKSDNQSALPPQIFTIETMLGCDLRCPECAIGCNMISRPKGFMSFEQFKIIADKISPYCKYIYLHNWGEPLLNPDIIRIIKYASQFAPCNISTNGMCLTLQLTEELITSGATDILVSIDGMTQQTYEKYRVGGDLNKALTALKMLLYYNQKHGNKVNIIPQFVVFSHNQHEIAAFRNFCHLFGVEPVFKAPYIRPNSRFKNADLTEYVRCSYPDFQSLSQAMSSCKDPWDVFTVLLDGSVVPCCYDHNKSVCFGNIFEQEVMEIWNSTLLTEFRSNLQSHNPPCFCLENCLLYLRQVPSQFTYRQNSPSLSYSDPQNADSCLFINTYYSVFIEEMYRKHHKLNDLPYDQQKNILQQECFGDSDFYSYWLTEAGLKGDELIVNCAPLQAMWAGENGCSATDTELVLEQVRRAQPSVVYIQDMNNTSKDFLKTIRPYVQLIVGQIATPVTQQIPFGCYDILFSSFPHYVAKFREAGLTSYYQALPFDPRVLQRISVPCAYHDRPISCSFVGGISPLHVESYRLLEILAKKTPIEFWGYGVETLPPGSLVRNRHHGAAWGKDMFQVMAMSRITVNRHGEVAENYANNMRLFEATGCGALLITDYKDNLQELFAIGKEVVAYRSPEECAALVNYYLTHPDEAEAIAKAGQARTLRDHTYAKRMRQTAQILVRHLRYQRETDRFPPVDATRISYGHTLIADTEVTPEMTTAWQSQDIPSRQRALVQQELKDMYRGNVAVPFRVLADVLSPIVSNDDSLLEIGCASGYYYEIIEYLLSKTITYTGVDYSEAMIKMAKEYYPQATFFTADGANLFFGDRQFHTVISSCVLLHVPNWRQHVFETVRVADKYVVASRTPVCRIKPTRYMKKYAYGVETVELLFNEAEIVREFLLYGLELVNAIQLQTNQALDEYSVTYLFRRHERRDAHVLG